MVTELQPITYDSSRLSHDQLMELYRAILLPRLIEEKMLSQLRQGKISKWFSGMGQEAISVGVASALEKDEYILPMHRNLGIFVTRDIPLVRLFAQFQGKEAGFTHGRDRSFHFGTKEHHIVGMISHLGPQMGIADGIALANKLGEEGKATLVFTGDGGASEGDFHEAVNVAAVWQLPVIIGIENNHWGLSTPSEEQFRCKQFIDKAIGYGIPEEDAIQVDGNNIVEVFEAVSNAAASIRKNPRPILMEFMTFRRRGHEEASGTKYYPEGLTEMWEVRDPVENFERHLLDSGILTQEQRDQLHEEIKKHINDELKASHELPAIEANTNRELEDRFRAFDTPLTTPSGKMREMRFIDAVQDGLRESMRKHDKLVLMGQDIAEYGGVFKVTEGFVEEFGKGRVRNTPLCESAILGAALGLSIKGWKGMMEMQFADFVSVGFNQIVNNLAKLHYRWGENADVVVRMPTGAGVGAGPFHSQSNEAWFFHTPGLRIAYPAFPSDAKGLLCRSFEDPNPVIFFEHKYLYRSLQEDVAEGYYTLPFGQAKLRQEGNKLSIITYGLGVHWALDYVKANDIDADVLDLRTLAPLDEEAIFTSVRKTGRALVLHEDCMTGGIGGELSALITENCFAHLDAPVRRCASMDTPVPFATDLERNFLANNRLGEVISELLEW
ncbi:MAG: dehydrogenase E1 component subunit alpha/beta [Flavobacteriales bacterium]|nr:dehydrogenase E1 component subunit alpha/beta [Flavobacteriales bacterium]